MMNVLVIGGTGFLGRHIVKELVLKGHQVSVLCRNLLRAKSIFSESVTLIEGDIDQLTIIDYELLFQASAFDGLVFAAGIDERTKPSGEPTQFFHQANVVPLEKILMGARNSSIERAVVLGSIFSYLNRSYPQLELASHHPYIHSRVQQSAIAHQLAHEKFIVTVLEVPWVFGATDGESPNWSSLVNYVRSSPSLWVTQGGANMMSVAGVAQAVHGALQYPEESAALPIGDTNLTWQQLLQKICDASGCGNKKIHIIKDNIFANFTKTGGFLQKIVGGAGGLNMVKLPELILRDAFFDAAVSKRRLHYQAGMLDWAIQQTCRSVPETVAMRRWRKTVRVFQAHS